MTDRSHDATKAPRVLFVCVGNSCRSQLAEAIARHHGLAAESAGTEPAAAVSSNALRVLEERGIDTAGLRPKVLDFGRLPDFTRTITMGCGVAESCPSLRTDEDWGLDDPVGEPIETFREVADDIERRVLALRQHLHDAQRNGRPSGRRKT